MELFDSKSKSEPLASRMRPRTINEYVGQDHILGEGRLLRRLIQADRLSSIILYGPPGTGKTTLARVIANSTESRFITMNAVLSGIKDLRIEIDEAKKQQDLYEKRTTLFIDEVHRWNKAQQDALLPWVENGTVILIGATTENPFFEVNPALVSRSRIFQLTRLTGEDLLVIARNALSSTDRGYGRFKVAFEEEALEHLVNISDGDARTLLNALELAVETSTPDFPPEDGTAIFVSVSSAEESIQKKVLLYDKEGDYHFDTISAFIKSIRGSDPDAALYWMARMIKAGEDPRYIFRRMLISASEDIGLADPQALVIVQAAAASYDRVGMPEGQFHLAQSALYLATAKKSNSALGFFDALASLEKEHAADIPNHLKDSNRDKTGFGHGEGYLYPHAFRDHWVAQQYLPDGLKGRSFYSPGGQGYEAVIKSDVEERKRLQLETFAPGYAEILSFSKLDSDLEQWIQRTGGESAQHIKNLVGRIFEAAGPVPRHGRMYIPTPGYGYIVWQGMKLVPEGLVYASCTDDRAFGIISNTASEIDETRKPVVENCGTRLFLKKNASALPFETIISVSYLAASNTKKEDLDILLASVSPNGRIVLCEPLVYEGSVLSELISDPSLKAALKKAEETGYRSSTAGEHDADSYSDLINSSIEEAGPPGFHLSFSRIVQTGTRVLSKNELVKWVGKFNSYDSGLDEESVVSVLSNRNVEWTRIYGLYSILQSQDA